MLCIISIADIFVILCMSVVQHMQGCLIMPVCMW